MHPIDTVIELSPRAVLPSSEVSSTCRRLRLVRPSRRTRSPMIQTGRTVYSLMPTLLSSSSGFLWNASLTATVLNSHTSSLLPPLALTLLSSLSL